MKINEITNTVVVRTEYVAEDGTVFTSKEECQKYEASALYAVAVLMNKHRICDRGLTHSDFVECGSSDDYVDIFQIDTSDDLMLLAKYLRLRLLDARVSMSSADSAVKQIVDTVTLHHEICIFWSYDGDAAWTYGDGSIDAFYDVQRDRLKAMISKRKDGEQ